RRSSDLARSCCTRCPSCWAAAARSSKNCLNTYTCGYWRSCPHPASHTCTTKSSTEPAEGATMLDPAVRRVLDGTPIAHLASVSPDGSPHVVPVWIGTRGDRAVVLTGPGSRKARNPRRDPRVALSIAPADNPFEPVVIRGQGRRVARRGRGMGGRRPVVGQVRRCCLPS